MANANELGTGRMKSGAGLAGATQHGAGRFPAEEMETLRGEMLQSGLDAWQTAEVLSQFLSGRGFGISANVARASVERMEETGFAMKSVAAELERLAMVM